MIGLISFWFGGMVFGFLISLYGIVTKSIGVTLYFGSISGFAGTFFIYILLTYLYEEDK